MITLDTYIGVEMFTVKVDDSFELSTLVEKAKALRSLTFSEKIQKVKELVLAGNVNAVEAYEAARNTWQKLEKDTGIETFDPRTNVVTPSKTTKEEVAAARKIYKELNNLVWQPQEHPLSAALRMRSLCCRYQGVLFFVLGYEADLGDKHFLQTAPVTDNLKTVFNDVIEKGELHRVNIFRESLVDKSLAYEVRNPNLYQQVIEELLGFNFFSYHRKTGGLVMISNPNKHIKISFPTGLKPVV